MGRRSVFTSRQLLGRGLRAGHTFQFHRRSEYKYRQGSGGHLAALAQGGHEKEMHRLPASGGLRTHQAGSDKQACYLWNEGEALLRTELLVIGEKRGETAVKFCLPISPSQVQDALALGLPMNE